MLIVVEQICMDPQYSGRAIVNTNQVRSIVELGTKGRSDMLSFVFDEDSHRVTVRGTFERLTELLREGDPDGCYTL